MKAAAKWIGHPGVWLIVSLMGMLLLSAPYSARKKPVSYPPIEPAVGNGLIFRDGQAFIDLNSADEALLTALPGIGQTLAERIVSDRNENGAFRSVEELTRVSGIGEKKLAGLSARAAVDVLFTSSEEAPR